MWCIVKWIISIRAMVETIAKVVRKFVRKVNLAGIRRGLGFGLVRPVCKRLVLFGLSALLVLAVGNPVAATLTPSQMTMYNENGIMYYDPDPCDPVSGNSSGGAANTVAGSGNAEQIWNYLASAGLGLTPEMIAGIMGNLQQESGFDPFIHNGIGYYGLFQANNGQYADLLAEIEAAGLGQYWHVTGTQSTAPPDAVAKAIQIELDYLTKKASRFVASGDSFSFMNNLDKVSAKTPEAYADLFQVTFEGGVGGATQIQDPVVRQFALSIFGTDMYQDMDNRYAFAKDVYSKYGGNTSGVAPVTSTSINTGAASVSDGWIGGIQGLTKEDVRGMADLNETPAGSFATSDGKPNMIILHYTAGTTGGYAAYPAGNKYPAHFTIDLINKKGYQHFPLTEPSLAVANYDRYAIQIEIVGTGYKDWAGVNYDPNDKYNLANFTEDEWNYLAYYLNAISEATGVPLTSSVDWSSPDNKLSDDEARNYRGILGHMHLPNNPGKADPGDIWEAVSKALGNNAGKSTYNASPECNTSGMGVSHGAAGSAALVSGGMNQEQANAFMQEYLNLQAQFAGSAAGLYVSDYDIYTTNCAPSGALGNCVAFSQYFVNKYSKYYSQNHWLDTTDGVGVVDRLTNGADANGFVKGTTPRPYAIFSYNNHTGVVLGVDEANDQIIIGEAGCYMGDDWTAARAYSLSSWMSKGPTFAYTDGALNGL